MARHFHVDETEYDINNWIDLVEGDMAVEEFVNCFDEIGTVTSRAGCEIDFPGAMMG